MKDSEAIKRIFNADDSVEIFNVQYGENCNFNSKSFINVIKILFFSVIQ